MIHNNTFTTAHLGIWIPYVTSSYLQRSSTSWYLDRLFSELSNHIQDLLEISVYCLIGSTECVVNHYEPLVMIYNIKEHCTCSYTNVWMVHYRNCLSLSVFIRWGKVALII